MGEPALRAWTVDAFFAWQEEQSERYELVSGLPVRMRAGAKNVHDDIVVNILGELRTQLRGTPCRPFTSDGSVETLPGQIRRPDVGVDCGRRDPEGLRAAEPRLVVEVLSPSTRDFDTYDKLAEYKTVASIDYVMVVEPNAADIALWKRDEKGAWERATFTEMEASIELPKLGATLALREIYDGVRFPPSLPRLIQNERG